MLLRNSADQFVTKDDRAHAIATPDDPAPAPVLAFREIRPI
jgi:hypothetical protein